MTLVVAVQAVLPLSKPGLTSFWPGLQLELPPIVHVNDVLPVAPAVSRAVTITLKLPAAVGVPEIRPDDALIDRPVGRPVADQVYGCEPPVADICRLIAAPTVPVRLPGLPTVGLPAAENRVYSSAFGEPVPGLLMWFGVALSFSACCTPAGEAVGLADRYSAAAPVTCGVAIDVPLMVLVAVSLLFQAEVMLTPGAKMS